MSVRVRLLRRTLNAVSSLTENSGVYEPEDLIGNHRRLRSFNFQPHNLSFRYLSALSFNSTRISEKSFYLSERDFGALPVLNFFSCSVQIVNSA